MKCRADDDELIDSLKGLPSTSERIRALHARGMSRGDIVRFLNAHFRQPGRAHDFRYQHVYNVLARISERRPPTQARQQEAAERPVRFDLVVRPDGGVHLPDQLMKVLGIANGGRLIARAGDGDVNMMSPLVAVRRAQNLLRDHIPGDDSLADSLVDERRQAARREMEDV